MTRRLHRYTIGEVLGRGAAGTVHAATLHGPGGLSIPVALKLLQSPDSDPQREARLGGLLRHAHLVDVYEVGEADGQWFMALEYCDGGALADHCPLPPSAVVEVGLQVASALSYAHDELELVHLDVKPGNLLLHQGLVKVADLGISSARNFNADGRIRGTPAFMAPEQRAGLPLDARADIYALGKTLSALASPPDSGETLDLETVDTLDATDEVALLPPALQWIVHRCTEPDPDHRYASMAELREALQQLRLAGPTLRECVPVPHPTQPPPEPHFGHDDELKRLRQLCEQHPVVQAAGPAGVGKSRLVRRLADGWSGPVISVDLAGATGVPSILGRLGQRLGVNLHLDQLEAQLGEVLQADALLILDHIDHIDIGPLVAAFQALTSTTVMVARLPVASLPAAMVHPLDQAAACRLFIHHAERRGYEVEHSPLLYRLIEQLDRIPLALQLAAGRLGVLTLDDLAERLSPALLRQAAGDRHSTLVSALEWTWDLLAPSARQSLAELAVFPGRFDPAAARAVLETWSDGALDELAEAGLLTQPEPGRLALLNTVRDFVRLREHPSTPAAVLRHAEHFAELGNPERLAAFDGPADRAAMERYLDAYPDLMAALSRAIDLGAIDIAARCIRPAWIVVERRGPYGVLRAQLQRLLPHAIAPRYGYYLHAALTLIHHHEGDMEATEHHMYEALHLAEESGDPDLICGACLNMSAAFHRRTRLAEAAEVLERAYALQRPRNQHADLSRIAQNLASVYINLGQGDEARKCFADAEVHLQHSGNLQGMAFLQINRGVLAQIEGDDALAERCFLEAIRGFAVFSPLHQASAEVNLGSLYADLLRWDDAITHLRSGLDGLQKVGDKQWLCYAWGRLGSALHRSGEAEQAEPALRQAVAYGSQIKNRRLHARFLAELCRLLWEQGRHAAARQGFDEALALVRDTEAHLDRSLILLWRGEYLEDQREQMLLQAREESPASHREFDTEWLRIHRKLGLHDATTRN